MDLNPPNPSNEVANTFDNCSNTQAMSVDAQKFDQVATSVQLTPSKAASSESAEQQETSVDNTGNLSFSLIAAATGQGNTSADDKTLRRIIINSQIVDGFQNMPRGLTLPLDMKILKPSLPPHMKSITERKIYDLTDPLFFDQVHSSEREKLIYFVEVGGVINRLKFKCDSDHSMELVDHNFVTNPHPLENPNVTDLLEDRMPHSMRFVNSGKVFFANGRGKIMLYHVKKESPFEWNLMAANFISRGSDNISDITHVNFALTTRTGYPLVITDAQTSFEDGDEYNHVVLIAPFQRPAYERTAEQTEIATKIFWLTYCAIPGEIFLKIVRHRVLEVDGVCDGVILSDLCDQICIAASHKAVCIFDSGHENANKGVRKVLSYNPLAMSYEWRQTDTVVQLIFTFNTYIIASEFNCEFTTNEINLLHQRKVLVRGKLGGLIALGKCPINVEHSFKTNVGVLTVEFTKAEPGKRWEFAVMHEHRGIERKEAVDEPVPNSITLNVFDGETNEFSDVTFDIPVGRNVFTGMPFVPNFYIPIGDETTMEFSYSQGICKNIVTIDNIHLMQGGEKLYVARNHQYFCQVWDKNNVLVQHINNHYYVPDQPRSLYALDRIKGDEIQGDIIGVLPLKHGVVFCTKTQIYVTQAH